MSVKYFKKVDTFQNLSFQFDLVDTLIGGTSEMIAAGELYLPREPAESPESYRIRLKNSTLLPAYKRTIAKAVGKAFAKGMNVGLPQPLEYLKDSVDGSGTSMETFAKQLLHSAINYGVTYILTDMPSVDTNNITRADVINYNIVPYLVQIKPTQVLDLKTDFVGANIRLTYFRFIEDTVEYSADGLLQKTVSQVKEFTLTEDERVVCTVYRKDNSGLEKLHETFEMTGFSGIPITPVYGNKIAPYLGSPVLIDLAFLNIKHWRQQSDYDFSMHYAMTPILALKGFNQTPDADGNITQFVLSANTAIVLPAEGSVDWVKGDASVMQQGRESLKHLEEQMDNYGLELTTAQAGGGTTATGRLIDAAESNSILKTIATDLEWSLFNAILIAGELIGVDATETSIDLDKTYTVSNHTDLALLIQLFEKGILTREEVRQELATRRVIMSENVDLTVSDIVVT